MLGFPQKVSEGSDTVSSKNRLAPAHQFSLLGMF